MNGRWIRLSLFYPEERPFAITKSPQIRMTVFALVRHEEFDMERLQGRLVDVLLAVLGGVGHFRQGGRPRRRGVTQPETIGELWIIRRIPDIQRRLIGAFGP